MNWCFIYSSVLIIKRAKIAYIQVCRYIYVYDLDNRSNGFHQIWNYIYFEDEKTIQIGLNLVKNRVLCLSVILFLNTNLVNLGNYSNDFHKIWHYMHFKHEKMIQIGLRLLKIGLPVCLSLNTTLVNIENRFNEFHKF